MEGWNDDATIAKTFSYNEADTSQARVQIFGSCQADFGAAGTYQVGQYDGEAIKAGGVDKAGNAHGASSILIPNGLNIRAWKGEVYNGESITIAGPDFVDLCFDKTYSGWND
jgi:hypothetical protein